MGEVLGQAVLELRTDDTGLTGGISKAKVDAEGLQGTFNETADAVVGSTTRMGQGAEQFSSALKSSRLEMNQSRIGMMEFQHIARGVSDQFATSGLSTQLFTSHIGELSEAVVLSGGAFGKVGLFLQGPWGIALTLATAAAVPLLANLLGQKNALDDVYDKLVKHKEQAALSAQAEDIWSHSIEGLVERSKKLNEQLERRLQTQTELNRATMQSAQNDFSAAMAAEARLQANPQATAKQLEDAEKAIHNAALALHNAQVAAAEEAGKAMASATESAKTWADQQLTIIKAIQGTHPELAEKAIADPMLAAFNELKAAIEAAAGAGIDFSKTVQQSNALNNSLQTGAISARDYDQGLKQLAASLYATIAAAKNAPKAIEDFKKAVIGAEGTGPNRLGSSAAGYGQFMPGTFESYFKRLYPQQAAGMSNPEIDALRNNRAVATAVIDAATKDYVTVLKSAGQQITAASLYTVHLLGQSDAKKLLRAPGGESTSDFLSAGVLKGNPFLRGTADSARAAIAKRIGDSSGAVSAGATGIQQYLDEQQRNLAAYNDEIARLDEQIIGARKKLAGSAEEEAKEALNEVEVQRQKTIADAQAKLAAGKIDQQQEQKIELEANELASLQSIAILRQQEATRLKQEDAEAEQASQFQVDALRWEDQLATTQKDHRDLQLAILDLVYQEKEAHLEKLKLLAEGNRDFAEANRLQGQINQLGEQKARERTSITENTADPLQQWARSVPQTAHEITEAIHGIEVHGLDGLTSAIAGVISGTESLKQAFGSLAQSVISDILQMIVKMLIFRAISSLLGGSIPSPDIGSPMSMNLPLAQPLAHLAGGGFMSIGGNGGVDRNLLSINGQPRAMVGADETLAVIPSGGGLAAKSNEPARIELIVSGDDLWKLQVGQVANAVVDLKTPGIVGQARKATMDSVYKRKI